MKKMTTCDACRADVEAWNERCQGCGFTLVLEPDEERRARALRRPALGALFFTQGWALGARLYGWFVLSLIPVVGFVALGALVLYGRRWSWKRGGWSDWKEFESRTRLLDVISLVWIAGLAVGWLLLRKNG